MWAQPIRLDPNWNNGDYYGRAPPIEGLKAALKLVSLQANSWEWARTAFGTEFKIERFLDQTATARAALADANHFLYLCKANQLAAVDPAKIKAPALILYAPTDLIFYEPVVRETVEKIGAAGGSAESATLIGPNGHLDAFTAIGQDADKITTFLGK
jgi:homoserine O-acetyltransferase/O-succinyltransferase